MAEFADNSTQLVLSSVIKMYLANKNANPTMKRLVSKARDIDMKTLQIQDLGSARGMVLWNGKENKIQASSAEASIITFNEEKTGEPHTIIIL